MVTLGIILQAAAAGAGIAKLGAALGAGLAALGGLIWSAYVDEATANRLLLRPPGALKEEDFLKTCIKCGMCVEACPFHTLKLDLCYLDQMV